MYQDRIAVGDIVKVDVNGAQLTVLSRAVVLYTPLATCDSWGFKDSDTGRIVYISTKGCTITLLEKKGE